MYACGRIIPHAIVSAGNPPPRASLRLLDPRGRIAALADPDSLVSLDVPRASPWLGRFGIAAQDDDGVATAALMLGGARVLAAAQDERFVGGSIGARHGEALASLLRRAIDERAAAVILLMASGGVRLFEANAAELAAARALRALLDARAAGVAVAALGVGDVFGGASVLACAAGHLALLPAARIGLSGPRVIEAARGRDELDASDAAAVDALFGATARAAARDVALIDDDSRAIRAWVMDAMRDMAPFGAQVTAMHERLDARAPGAAEGFTRPALLQGRNDAMAMDATGRLWRVGNTLVTAPFTGRAFDGASVHALDSALLDAASTSAADALVVTEDSRGHDVSRAAEARFDSCLLAQHAAVLAYLRHRGMRVTGLLCGSGHSAAFFVNALQGSRLFAVADARVVAMEPAAIARVTGRDVAALIDDDPLLGQPVRHFAALGGVDGVVDAADALDILLGR